jgi:protein tyrosine phosphatase (PTP) superfamily phosphohydrolase (DUF442 family)
LLLLGLGLLAACASTDAGGTAPAPRPELAELGTTRNVTALGDLILAGQPSAEDLGLAARRGITRVINLRTPAEMERVDFDQAARCAELGLDYVGIAIDFTTMDDATFDAVLELLDRPAPDGGKTLLHCASGNRVAVFVAVRRMLQDGVSYEEALIDAQAGGMKPGSLPTLEAQAARRGLLE